MVFDAARLALSRLLTPAFRGVLWKSLGLTLAALILAWLALTSLFGAFALPFVDGFLPDGAAWAGWLGTAASILAGLAIALGLALLVAPVTALVAGLFLDDVAELIEHADYGHEPPGTALPTGRAIVVSTRFFLLAVAANLFALLLLLVPGVNLIAFFVVNGYLLGREYFEFAATRFAGEEGAAALRRTHRTTVFLAGLLIAGFLAVPVVNLATPLFAAAMMTHLARMTAGARPA